MAMACASTSSLRCVRLASSTPLSVLTFARRHASSDSFPSRGRGGGGGSRGGYAGGFGAGRGGFDDIEPPARPPRPASPYFYSGQPVFTAEMTALEDLLSKTQTTLQAAHVFPLPAIPALQMPQLPDVRWKTPAELAPRFGRRTLNTALHRRITTLLNELNRLRYLAQVGGRPDVAQRVAATLGTYSRPPRTAPQPKDPADVVGKYAGAGIDAFGRTYGLGRRKEASARVWIIPSQQAGAFLDAPFEPFRPDEPTDITATASTTAALPTSEILVNHLPMPSHFPRPIDRERIVRPLRLTGLLGAYNIFALVRGGGLTGQADAIAMGLAKALVAMRHETKDVLFSAGLLMRDTRMVERKKTGRVKARKKPAWVKR